MSKYDPKQVYDIPLKDILADEDFNSRGIIDPGSVLDLSRDIDLHGLMQPVLVEPKDCGNGKCFRLIAGYRRFMAFKMLSRDTIPVLVREGLNDLEARLLNLSENLHRQELNMVQESKAIEHFRRAGWTIKEISDRVKMSPGWVQIRLYILELPEEIQEEIKAGVLKTPEIAHCWRLKEPSLQIEYVKQVKDRTLLGKKKEIDPAKIKEKAESKRLRTRDEIFEMQDLIRENFGYNPFANKALAWASGEIDQNELMDSLDKELIKVHGRHALVTA